MASKRKYHRPPGSQKHRSGSSNQPFSMHDAKRRRLSSDSDRNEDIEKDVAGNGHDTKTNDSEDDGWTKVISKASKSRKPRQKNGNYDHGDYPRLRYHDNYRDTIRLADLRDLGLYLLADEVAPRWIAIANSKHVKKVVTICVPGLDEKLLRRAQRRLDDDPSFAYLSAAVSEQPNQSSSANSEQESVPTKTENGATEAVQSIVANLNTWLFKHVLEVKAPGDAKANRVHSPLQAMLLAPDPQQKKNPNVYQDKGFQAIRTSIVEFVHDSDELREAGFPIHPASFTNKTDAELEAERREKTGQGEAAGWVDTKVESSQVQFDSNSKDPIAKGTEIYSIDCEMVQTSDGVNSLARVSMISHPAGKVIIDKLVKPDLPITNYFTQYSGITPQKLENITTTLKEVQQELLSNLTPSSILLGHSLDSDLNALKLTHPFVVDTSIIYPHPRGLPLRSSLKYLANKYLKREIQSGGANGHNSVEDAQAVLDLVKQKCEKGPKWGTMEANGESIFKRLTRNGRTSAMIDYGTPERGFGKDATYTFGAQDDDGVVQGIIRHVKGDGFFDFGVPAGGVEYVWGRLRALEYARGWVGGASTAFQEAKPDVEGTVGGVNDKEKEDKKEISQLKDDDGDQEELMKLACETLRRLQQIYDALPEKSLLVLFSGTSDVRPVMRLQAQQQQYKKEFKVKKWDELTIKWTDTEEQALRRACENARAGWAVCTIK